MCILFGDPKVEKEVQIILMQGASNANKGVSRLSSNRMPLNSVIFIRKLDADYEKVAILVMLTLTSYSLDKLLLLICAKS